MRRYLDLSLPLGQVGIEHVEVFKEARAHDVGPSTLRKELTALSGVFRWANLRGYVKSNPVRLVKRPREPLHQVRVLTTDEETRLLRVSPVWLGDFILAALHTGLDLGDLLVLSWQQVGDDSIYAPRGKTGRVRHVPINPVMRGVLDRARSAGRIRPFPFARTKVKSAHYRAKMASGVKVGFKVFRHTFASRLAEAGVAPGVLADLLGHALLSMTRRYTHASERTLHDAVARLPSPSPGLPTQKAAATLESGTRSDGWGAGTRTPVPRSRAVCPTTGRLPSNRAIGVKSNARI